MDIENRLNQTLSQSLEALQLSSSILSSAIGLASIKIARCLIGDGKIMICGNAGSAAIAQLLTSHLIEGIVPRPPLAAIALGTDAATLTSIAKDSSYGEVFSKQVQALGREGDTLLVITTSGNTENIIEAVIAAHERDIAVIALTGADGGQLADMLTQEDIEIRAPADHPARIHEIHLLAVHALCDLIDHQLFGEI